MSQGDFKKSLGIAFLAYLLASQAVAGLEVVANRADAVFANGKRVLSAQFHNPDNQANQANLRFRVYQASSSTLAPLGDTRDLKRLSLDAGQTVLESFEVELPAVRAETVFKVFWLDGERKIGATIFRAFPPELLKPLATLAGETPVGIIDPEGQFKAVAGSLSVSELKEAEDITATDARLILVAPMPPAARPDGLTTALKRRANSGACVVWIQPPDQREVMIPDAYVVNEGEGRIVIAAAETIERLADSPRAQLNLVRLAELATGRKKLELPTDSN